MIGTHHTVVVVTVVTAACRGRVAVATVAVVAGRLAPVLVLAVLLLQPRQDIPAGLVQVQGVGKICNRTLRGYAQYKFC